MATCAQNLARAQGSQVPIWSTSEIPPWSTATRPLSDIRELTEPSLVDWRGQDQCQATKRVEKKPSLARKASTKAKAARSEDLSEKPQTSDVTKGRRSPSPFNASASQEDQSSIYSVPGGTVPLRSSSQLARKKSTSRGKIPPVLSVPSPQVADPLIPEGRHSQSPVRNVASGKDLKPSEVIRRLPFRTLNRLSQPNDILDCPYHRHHRISLDLQLAASLFVGGGDIEGSIRVIVDEAERIRHRKTLAFSRISVDLLGVEEASGGRRSIFFNLTTELIDAEHPPPRNMVGSEKKISPVDPFWYLLPSVSNLPFLLNLPLDVGPPPFNAKNAKIRYIVCVTMLIRDTGRQYLVRTSQSVSVLSVYDPEKALMSLPSPLTASDECVVPRGSSAETVKLSAGIHRQVWVSGTSIFADIRITNSSRKNIKKVELHLERDILYYKHTAASTLEKSIGQARIFDSNERSIQSKVSIKSGSHGWNGVPAYSADARTCDLDLPRGHATVKCGKFFEVRYFINIVVFSHTKLVSVQLPIVLIHMNSLDIVPNSVAQVAAAIEEKRQTHHPGVRSGSSLGVRNPRSLHQGSPRMSRTLSQPGLRTRSIQGRAFAAPRMASLERARADATDIDQLTAALDASPRKRYRHTHSHPQMQHQNSQFQQQQVRPMLKTHASFDTQQGMAFSRTRFAKNSQSQHGRLQYSPENDSLQPYDENSHFQFEYQTPPSNRKARLVGRTEADDLARRLRHVRSDSETKRSVAGEAKDHQKLCRKPFVRSTDQEPGSGLGLASKTYHPFSSAHTFRNAEVKQTCYDLDAPLCDDKGRAIEVPSLSSPQTAPIRAPLVPTTLMSDHNVPSSAEPFQARREQNIVGGITDKDHHDVHSFSRTGDSHKCTERATNTNAVLDFDTQPKDDFDKESHGIGMAGISGLGGSVLRRLEPNRIFEGRRKKKDHVKDEGRGRSRDRVRNGGKEKGRGWSALGRIGGGGGGRMAGASTVAWWEERKDKDGGGGLWPSRDLDRHWL